MERLTYWCDDGQGDGEWRVNANRREESGPHVDRLAAYEDTELKPETISKIRDIVLDISGDLNRLRELAQAHKENRVLPEGSGWFVTCSGKKLTVVMDIEAALRREQDG